MGRAKVRFSRLEGNKVIAQSCPVEAGEEPKDLAVPSRSTRRSSALLVREATLPASHGLPRPQDTPQDTLRMNTNRYEGIFTSYSTTTRTSPDPTVSPTPTPIRTTRPAL